MKKTILIFLCFLFEFGFVFGQVAQFQSCTGCSTSPNVDNSNTNFTYSASVSYDSRDVASDFGPRWVNRYDWHNGVDFSSYLFGGYSNNAINDRGDAIIAIEGGTVAEISASGNYKYITIDGEYDFGYGHIFHSGGIPQRSGVFVLTTLDEDDDEYAIVNTLTRDAIGPVEGTVTLDGTVYMVENEVVRGQAIAPIGGSGNGATGFGPHIHLYRFRDPYIGNASTEPSNGMDPLSIINYTSPDYFIEINTQDETVGNIVWSYPEDNTETIKVNIEMNNPLNARGDIISPTGTANRYSNGVNDIDDVRLMIKRTFEEEANYRMFEGPSYESRITLGGRTTTQLYPNRGTRNGDYDNTRGSWTRTGLDPFAYADGTRGRPKDDYYFADISPRINLDNNEMAHCPQQARYDDGTYHLRARVQDVRGGTFNSDEIEISFDNFQPFVTSVTAEIANKTFYQKNWTCSSCNDSGGIQLTGEDLETEVSYRELISGIDLIVQTSEPMEDLILSLPELNILGLTSEESNEEKTIWLFHVPYIEEFSKAFDVTFEFSGMDISGNPILSLEDFVEDECTAIPFRTGSDSWSIPNFPNSIDASHSFSFNCGSGNRRNKNGTRLIISSDDCLAITATTTNVSETGSMDGTISLMVEGGVAPYQYIWDNGATTNSIENLSEGQYCVTITDDSCCEEEACFTVANGCMTFNVTTKER